MEEEFQNADIFKITEAEFEEQEEDEFNLDNFYDHDDYDRSHLNSQERHRHVIQRAKKQRNHSRMFVKFK